MEWELLAQGTPDSAPDIELGTGTYWLRLTLPIDVPAWAVGPLTTALGGLGRVEISLNVIDLFFEV